MGVWTESATEWRLNIVNDDNANPQVDEAQLNSEELDAVAGGQEFGVSYPAPGPSYPYPYIYNPYTYSYPYPGPINPCNPNYSPGPALLNGQWHF